MVVGKSRWRDTVTSGGGIQSLQVVGYSHFSWRDTVTSGGKIQSFHFIILFIFYFLYIVVNSFAVPSFLFILYQRPCLIECVYLYVMFM